MSYPIAFFFYNIYKAWVLVPPRMVSCGFHRDRFGYSHCHPTWPKTGFNGKDGCCLHLMLAILSCLDRSFPRWKRTTNCTVDWHTVALFTGLVSPAPKAKKYQGPLTWYMVCLDILKPLLNSLTYIRRIEKVSRVSHSIWSLYLEIYEQPRCMIICWICMDYGVWGLYPWLCFPRLHTHSVFVSIQGRRICKINQEFRMSAGRIWMMGLDVRKAI
jgi:hypothetical protein